MRLYSCDVCGKTLQPNSRFLWKVEGGPVASHDEPTVLENDELDETDSVEEVDELLIERETQHDESDETDGETVEMLPICTRRSFDVCGSCYMKLVSDPLGREARQARPYSRN